MHTQMNDFKNEYDRMTSSPEGKKIMLSVIPILPLNRIDSFNS